MKIASVADVKAKFSAYLKSSEEGPVVITNESRRMPRPFKGSGGSRAHEC